jgi:large subunit ribosomal protein L24
MKIKTGDKVKMLVGKDKGKTGKVLQVLAAENKVAVEGLNLVTKNQRGKRQGEKGQRIQYPRLVNASKVAVICPKCGQIGRVGYKIVAGESKEGKKAKSSKFRICGKCEETI